MFFTVIAYDKSVDDFMVLGIYSKREDADAHVASLPELPFPASVHLYSREGIARDLISNHLAYIAPGNRRVSITIAPSETERGGSRVNISSNPPRPSP
jgi:hypothetical protein